MSSSNFLINPATLLVFDASVVINLNATRCALEIIRALPGCVVVTENALAELAAGARKGHSDHDKLQALIECHAVRLVQLGEVGNRVYASLVEGSAARTLDDGEAATIGFAQETGSAAIIDERKAQTICAAEFPDVTVRSTVDLLIHELITEALGKRVQSEAIVNALRDARMRVAPHQIETIVGLIGDDVAGNCASLPRKRRARL